MTDRSFLIVDADGSASHDPGSDRVFEMVNPERPLAGGFIADRGRAAVQGAGVWNGKAA